MPWNGTRSTKMLVPPITSTLAATTIPAVLAGADTSLRSSTTPTTTISVAASMMPSGSVLPEKISSKASSCHAVSMPANKPTSIATPPSVGVGRSCTRRSSGFTTAPMRMASRRTTGVAASVVTTTTTATIA